MNPALLEQWQRLIFPLDGLPVRAGEQAREGNRYPDVQGCPDWAAHQGGRKTYAVNPCYPGPDGDCCRWAVLDIDEGSDSLAKARALLAVANAAGLAARAAWSGSKGAHVWLFFEPAPVGVVRAVLNRLRAAVPFTGETIPGENQRAKLPPAFHQERRLWAFWFETLPDVPPAMRRATTAFLDAQAAILAGVVPSTVATLAAYANAGKATGDREPEPEAAMVPDLGKLGGDLSPCIRALAGRGAQTALGAWDKNALTLARYARAAGLSDEAGAELLETLAEHTGPDFPTGKDRDAQRRHWRSIGDPGPFGCGYILTARQALGFRCADCAARPAGVKAGKAQPGAKGQPGPIPDNAPELGAALLLEPALADSLLQLALQAGMPEARITPAIFPSVALPELDPRTGKPAMATLHALAWAAIGAGQRTPAAMLNGIDRQPDPPGPAVKRALATLVTRLLGLSPVPADEAAALVERAADLTARRELLAALGAGTTATNQRRPLMNVIGGLHETTARLQAATGTAWGAPLVAYAAELLEGLVTVDRPTVATPFESLNDLLGGGLHGGKLYVLAAPPGGGKTTLASQIADVAAAAGCPVAYVAMEMGRGQLFDYALARRLGLNSAKVEARNFRQSEHDRERLAQAATDYLETVAPWLSVIEGDWNTTAAALGGWVAQARARYQLTPTAPVLVVVDYLQLLNTGDEKLDSGGVNETPKVSQVAVQLKQLARDSGAALLALSDVVKSEQGAAMKGTEFTLNMLRGSNRIAHAADVVLALYSEAAKGDGGKADSDPWDLLAQKYADSPRARDFGRALDDLRHSYPTGGPGAVVRARLELLKNRGGRGRGSQVLLYERAFHRFKGLSVPGQDAAEGRG
ncbi:MAG: DnaB-like helicase C-terminal domain-containing protein [Candidatus Contendobacter sp.]